MRGCRTAAGGYPSEEISCIVSLRAALVVEHHLIRLMPGELYCGTVSPVHTLKVLPVTYMVTDKSLAVGINNLEHLQTRSHRLAVLVSLIIKVDLRTVTIPQGIPARRQEGNVLACVPGFSLKLAVHCIKPPRLDISRLQNIVHGSLRFEPFPASCSCYKVVFREYLGIGIDWEPASLELHQNVKTFISHLAGVRVGKLAGNKALISLPPVLAHLVPQPRLSLRQGVPFRLSQSITLFHYRLPLHRRPVAHLMSSRLLGIFHRNQPVKYRCVESIFLDELLLQAAAVRQFISAVESAGLFIDD